MDAEEDVIRDNGEHINSMSSNKYFIIPQNPVNNDNFDNCCPTSVVLSISNFNHSDSGHYWCQFVANNRPLLPSPYGYISLSEGAGSNSQACTENDLTRQLDPAECAGNSTMSHSGRMSCASHTTTAIVTPATDTDSTQSRSVTNIEMATTNSGLYTPRTTYDSTTPKVFVPKENNSQINGAIAGAIVCFLIVLFLVVVCLVIAIYKYKKLEKKSK